MRQLLKMESRQQDVIMDVELKILIVEQGKQKTNPITES